MKEITWEGIINDYETAILECANILKSIDQKHGTYGKISLEDIDITAYEDRFQHYIRFFKWHEILIQ